MSQDQERIDDETLAKMRLATAFIEPLSAQDDIIAVIDDLRDARQQRDTAIREIERRPSLHPHSKHKTQAGPARHVLVGKAKLKGGGWPHGRTIGLLYPGMRNYGSVIIEAFEDHRPRRRLFDFARWMAVAKYRRAKYARDLMNAMTEAWRC